MISAMCCFMVRVVCCGFVLHVCAVFCDVLRVVLRAVGCVVVYCAAVCAAF